MLQGKSIIPPATHAIKMLIKTFIIWHKLRTFSSTTSCAYFFRTTFSFLMPLVLRIWEDGWWNCTHPNGGPPGARISFYGRESNLSNEKQKIINRHILNKSTTIFHGLHSYRSWKWRHKMFKTLQWNHSPAARGSTWVLNINFYGVISIVYKSVDHGKLWSICFLQ